MTADRYTFPYEDNAFDFIFATSVFTHMLPAGVDRYLSEMARTLKPGKKCLITYFLLNDGSRSLLKAGKSSLDFKYNRDGCRLLDFEIPETAVALKETVVRGLHEKYGLTILEPIRYGGWCGRHDHLSYQDIVIATKN